MLKAKRIKIVHDEFLLETVRQTRFQNSASRLQGLYFFESETDALRANKEWGFNLPEHFLCSFDIDETGITCVDSEWITHKIGSGNADNWMERYWVGEAYGKRPLMEVIVADGIGFINNQRLRQEAYKTILNKYPFSTRLLSASCCAFNRGFLKVAQVVPCLILNKDILSGDYLIYLGDFETTQKETLQQIFEDCAQSGELPQWIPHPDPNISFQVPDFSLLKFEFHPTDLQLLNIKPHFQS